MSGRTTMHPTAAPPPTTPITVSGPEGQTVACRTDETLLDAWLRSGVAAQFSCRGGSCHTCMLRCVEGELPERAQLGVPEHLRQQGYFLPCLCVPTSTLQVGPVRPDDFITDCVIESSEAQADGWLLRLEPMTRYPAEPGQYTCVRIGDSSAATSDWFSPWRVTNRQEEDFYLHLLLELLAGAAPPAELTSLSAGSMVQLRPTRAQATHPDSATAAPIPTATPAASPTPHAAAPDLWAELGHGSVVRAVLQDFYTRVYADPVLAPFFRNVTQERVVGKQYAFLHDEMIGQRADYFGDSMKNVHHWMVITDAVFDHRQRLMETVLREHQLSESQIARWMHFEERHRGDIVKDAPWQREFGGQIMPVDGYEEETLSCGAMCDHCGREVHAGEVVLYHVRLGTISCDHCRASAT